MKKFFITIVLLFVVIIIGLFVFILTFDLNRYKPFLIEKVEGAIKKDVRIGNISLNFLPGLAFRIDGISIKDTDKSWEDAILKAASIEASLKLLPLLKKDIQIERLSIRGLNITLTKDFLTTLSKPKGADDNSSEIGAGSLGALKFMARSISITDSSINYVDKVSEKPLDIKADIIKSNFKNISLYGPVDIDVSLSVFGRGRENVLLSGTLYPEFESKKPYIKNLDLKADLSKFSLENALSALGKTDISRQFIGKEIAGDIAVSSEKLYLDPKKIYDSSIFVSLSKGATSMLPIKDGLEDVELKADIKKGDVIIERFTGSVAKGTFSARGAIKGVVSSQQSNLDIALQDIDVARLLPDIEPGKPHFEGRLSMNLRSSATGLGAQKMLDTLTMEGTVKLDKAVLEDMNILTVALDKLDILPGLVPNLKSSLPERYSELLKQNYTVFKPVETGFKVENRKLVFQKLLVESDAFYLTGNGYLGIDGNISMHSDLFIPQDLSSAFIGVVNALAYLQNAEGMITMPLEIRGNLPDISVMPDLDYVIQKLAVSKGQELLERIFKKRKGEGDAGSGSGEETKTQKEREQAKPEPTEVLIKTIFDIITAPRDKEGK